MREGIIMRALSGFYYVRVGSELVQCRARGRFRKEGITPLVGDRVVIEDAGDGTGTVGEILPRKNAFSRPAVANVDYLVMVVSAAIPVTDPFLIDRVTVQCEKDGCGVLLAVNKCDLDPGDKLREIYVSSGYSVYPVSALTGEGVDALRQAMRGKACCFTGNSGVGKSSLINALAPGLDIPTAEVSRKLGRGKHTTRHVELFDLGGGTLICDTPGFASYGDEAGTLLLPEELPDLFPEFRPYLGRCRYSHCTHLCEDGCRILQAVSDGEIARERQESYCKLYRICKALPPKKRFQRET